MTRDKSYKSDKPLLYLVATPIGNLKEMSSRALQVLSDMDVIAAEDTRNTYTSLANYGIKKELFSLREHNENEASMHLIKLLKAGKKVAYVSDAGYPGISDPGYLLVVNALKEGINISTISGSSAFINALVASGLKSDHFYFYGFLPVKENEAKKALENMKNYKDTLIFYESPHRINKTLHILYEVLGNRKAVIARELTKINEEYIRGDLKELIDIEEESLKGEMVVLVEGNQIEASIDDAYLLERIDYFVKKGLSPKTAIEVVSEETKINKNHIYKIYHQEEK